MSVCSGFSARKGRSELIVKGTAIYAGSRHGEKNGKTWMNAFLDDEKDMLARMQVFVPVELHNTRMGVAPGSRVSATLRLYMKQGQKFPEPACTLEGIEVIKG